jgi:hypothetical protein
MTVRTSLGDLGGDVATPPPARGQDVRDGGGSPEWVRGSRFWLLQSSDDEEDGGEDELSSDAEDIDVPIRYLCHTPSPMGGIDIDEDSRELARRTLKRIRKRDAQQAATKASIELAFSEGKCWSSLLRLGSRSAKISIQRRPVLEPSVFTDEDDGGWTVVHRRHRPPVNTERARDPKRTDFSKKLCLGPERPRASPIKNQVRWNPSVARNHIAAAARSSGDRGPTLVKVGSSLAGRAFRKILGFS